MCCSSCAPSREYSTPLITIVVLPTLARSNASARSGCRGAGARAWRVDTSGVLRQQRIPVRHQPEVQGAAVHLLGGQIRSRHGYIHLGL